MKIIIMKIFHLNKQLITVVIYRLSIHKLLNEYVAELPSILDT